MEGCCRHMHYNQPRERMGYEVSVLDKIRKPKVQNTVQRVLLKRLIMKFILRRNICSYKVN